LLILFVKKLHIIFNFYNFVIKGIDTDCIKGYNILVRLLG